MTTLESAEPAKEGEGLHTKVTAQSYQHALPGAGGGCLEVNQRVLDQEGRI